MPSRLRRRDPLSDYEIIDNHGKILRNWQRKFRFQSARFHWFLNVRSCYHRTLRNSRYCIYLVIRENIILVRTRER